MKKNIGICIVVCIVVMCIGIMLLGDRKSDTTYTMDYDLFEEYKTILLADDELQSGLYVFPEKLQMDSEDTNVMYVCQEQTYENSYEILLKVQYSDSKYQEEIKRLSEVQCEVKTTDGSKINKIKYTEDDFQYPAYVAIQGCNQSYEYALLDEERKEIVYVFCKSLDYFNIPTQYVPKEYTEADNTMTNSWENYNIYFASEKNGDYSYYRD